MSEDNKRRYDVVRWSWKIARDLAEGHPDQEDRARGFVIAASAIIREAFRAQRARSDIVAELTAAFAASEIPKRPENLEDFRQVVAMTVHASTPGTSKKKIKAHCFALSTSPNRMRSEFEAGRSVDDVAAWVLQGFASMMEAKAAKIAADVEKAREAKTAKLAESEITPMGVNAEKAAASLQTAETDLGAQSPAPIPEPHQAPAPASGKLGLAGLKAAALARKAASQ